MMVFRDVQCGKETQYLSAAVVNLLIHVHSILYGVPIPIAVIWNTKSAGTCWHWFILFKTMFIYW